MARKKIRFGIIGLGLMGREFGSAAARWCHLLTDGSIPEIVGICDSNREAHQWFQESFPSITLVTTDYHELLASDEIEAVYCAVPHHLHEEMYVDTIQAGKQAAFLQELEGKTEPSFGCFSPEETRRSHALQTAALKSHTYKRVEHIQA